MISKSSHQRCSAKFTGKHLCQSLFFNKVAGLRPATSLKKRLWYTRFPVNIAKLLRKLFLWKTCGGCFWTENKDFTIATHYLNIPSLSKHFDDSHNLFP